MNEIILLIACKKKNAKQYILHMVAAVRALQNGNAPL